MAGQRHERKPEHLLCENACLMRGKLIISRQCRRTASSVITLTGISAAVKSSIRYAVFVVCAGVSVTAYFLFSDSSKLQNPDTRNVVNSGSGVNSQQAGSHGTAWAASPFAQGSAMEQSEDITNIEKTPDAIYSRSGKPVNFDGKNAAQYIEQWIAAARRGDKDAAYKVYQAESVCASNDEQVGNFQTEDDQKEFMREREATKKICHGVSPAQVQERMHFLELAARGGDKRAQIDFYMEGPGGRTDNAISGRSDPAFKQWRADAVDYLKSAAGQGDPFAMGLLSTVYGSDSLGVRDPKLAMAYSIAEATARGRQLTDSQLKNRFGKQLSSSDFTAAIQMGAQMSSDCCSKP